MKRYEDGETDPLHYTMDIAGIRIYERYSIKYFLKSSFLSLIHFF